MTHYEQVHFAVKNLLWDNGLHGEVGAERGAVVLAVTELVFDLEKKIHALEQGRKTMEWPEWTKVARALIDFDSLTSVQKEQVMLMMDGLKYRKQHS